MSGSQSHLADPPTGTQGSIIASSEAVPDVGAFGFVAFTTTRQLGTFGANGDEPVKEVMGRWYALRRQLLRFGPRMATAGQVHGDHILWHDASWRGWLRGEDADGHFARERGTALIVTVADCVPVFVAHPSGAAMALHSGWRGTAARIVERGLATLKQAGLSVADARIHLGPAICGNCYEVSADVYSMITGRNPGRPTTLDLRAVLADQARSAGARHITTSAMCTRCNSDLFYSHRAGDLGRQVGVIIASE